MEESLVDVEVSFVSDDETAEVTEPCVGAFDLPALAVTSEASTVLSWFADAVSFVWNDQFDPAFLQSSTKRIAVVGLVRDQPVRLLSRSAAAMAVGDTDRSERGFGERDFGR